MSRRSGPPGAFGGWVREAGSVERGRAPLRISWHQQMCGVPPVPTARLHRERVDRVDLREVVRVPGHHGGTKGSSHDIQYMSSLVACDDLAPRVTRRRRILEPPSSARRNVPRSAFSLHQNPTFARAASRLPLWQATSFRDLLEYFRQSKGQVPNRRAQHRAAISVSVGRQCHRA